MRAARVLAFVLVYVGLLVGLPRTALATTGCSPATANTNVTTNETWTLACSPYNVTAHVSVTSGATLTIEPGVQVRFGSNLSLTVGVGGANTGKLIANGTAADPVVFTSSLASPTTGSWSGLTINNNVLSGSSLTHAIIRYAGPASTAALRLNQVPASVLTVSNVEIANCAKGVDVTAGSPTLDYLTVSCSSATAYGFTSTSATFELTHSTISGGISAQVAPTSGGVSDTTFTNYDAGLPAKLHPGRVGNVIGQNTLQGATTNSFVDVVGGAVMTNATWPVYR